MALGALQATTAGHGRWRPRQCFFLHAPSRSAGPCFCPASRACLSSEVLFALHTSRSCLTCRACLSTCRPCLTCRACLSTCRPCLTYRTCGASKCVVGRMGREPPPPRAGRSGARRGVPAGPMGEAHGSVGEAQPRGHPRRTGWQPLPFEVFFALAITSSVRRFGAAGDRRLEGSLLGCLYWHRS